MSRSLRFVVLLVVGLAGLTWGAYLIVQESTRAWFEKDLRLRASLAINGARPALLERWQGDRDGLRDLLDGITQDERIMAACACGPQGTPVVETEEYPAQLPCRVVLERMHADGIDPLRDQWTSEESLPGGNVHLASLPLSGEDGVLGFVVLVQDLSFVERREAATRKFLLIAFAVLALSASLITLIASRMSWRKWSDELRRVLHGGRQKKEFQPILKDVRELVDRLLDQAGRAWNAARLKEVLQHQLDGERVVIIANREPYVHQHGPDGRIQVVHPASGLVTALEPVLRACSGTWIAHGSGSADRETADRRGRLPVPPGEGSYWLRRVWLSQEEERGYYYGFANEGLWPLCHIAHARPLFRGEDWEQYRAVNQRFAATLLEEVDREDPIVLVQDYHFALVPALIRKQLPLATVIMFWHIPWPNSEQFGICPWRIEVLEGMLGASILGFHTQFHCNNFFDSVDRYLEARIDREGSAVVHRGERSLVKPYPISVEWPPRWLQSMPDVPTCRASVIQDLQLGPGVRLGVGIDRLDYTKGIEERLLAVERLFERQPELLGQFTFVQLAAPSRTEIDRYRMLGAAVEQVVERINRRFAREGWQPVVLLRAHHEPPTVYRYLRAADVCYVSSLHDGMNLVAKEFIAAREDEQGVLVLSQFTGAARELTEALIVNPYNLDEASEALASALRMSAEEQRARMRFMRSYLAEFNVYRWAGRMLLDAARLRRRERLGRSSEAASAVIAS